ncbi:MAG TPA: hypothetical protein VKW76_11205 [Candidatus Binatia bacterium]|nr:hypothetical protein [Candidatus Binatia bacterium]
MLLLAAGAFVLATTPAWAGSKPPPTAPGPGEAFDCSTGGTTSCATDDTGCVSNTKNHAKCSSAIGKAIGKAVGAVIKCHSKQAQALFKGADETQTNQAEEICEQGAKAQLDQAITKLTGLNICDPIQLTNEATEESVLFGVLDSQNSSTYCDSASEALIGDDDTGWVPSSANSLKCEQTVGKNIAKLVAAVLKCHDKLNGSDFKGKDFDEESCEMTNPSQKGALDKYNQQVTKLLGLNICPPCMANNNGQGMNDLAANALSQLDGSNSILYPCNLGP